MTYKIAICDDLPEDAQAIADMVTMWAEQEKYIVETEVFPSAESFLFQYEQTKDYDILLLDVEMKEMSGIELAKKIRQENERVEMVFITSHFELSGEGYEVDALHYLVKPVSQMKLMAVLSKAAKKLSVEPPSLMFSCDGETVKLYESYILYIEAFLHYIVIHTTDREYRLKGNISAFAEKLSDDFFQTHRSYLVSLKHVVRISHTSVWLDCGVELPLARGKYDKMNYAFIERN